MIPVLLFPQFDPTLVQIGPFAIRWYALAYIGGIVLGWRLLRRLVQAAPAVATLPQADDFVTWATLGIVLGGRLGYVLFYQPVEFLARPWTVFEVWHGGMSFHGGMLGTVIALVIFCYRNRISLLGFADRLAPCVPIGLGFGRIANFINGELWGRPAPEWLPWAMIFPADPWQFPRHPSQIYQALLEGLVLFVVMLVLAGRERLRARFGFLTGAFLAGYAVARIIGELFRQPDPFLGFLFAGVTMGQLLSLPMLLVGVWLMARSRPPRRDLVRLSS